MKKKFITLQILFLTTLLTTCFGPAEIIQSTFEIEDTKVPTIVIGDQEWIAENLNVTHFANGDPILHAQTVKEWKQAGEAGKPAWCFYANDPENGEKYGRLYNWYAVADSRGLAPEGWRIPNDADWEKLIDNFGNKNNAGKRMKSIEGWLDEGNGELPVGFNAYPAGGRYNSGTFSSKGSSAFFWSASSHLMFYGRYFVIHHNKKSIEKNSLDKNYGFSVRCVRDINAKKSKE